MEMITTSDKNRNSEALLQKEDADRMAKVLRHRLRNIASGIRGAIGLISEEAGDSLPPDLQEYFPLIMRECTSLQDMASRLGLLFCPIIEPYAPTPAGTMLQKILADMAVEFPNVEFRTEGQTSTSSVSNLLEIALTDLIRNACEATPRGIVGIRIESSPEQICWTICDSGNGIPPDQRDQAFLPFFTTRPRHLGLGLPIAAKICEVLGATCGNTIETGSPNEWSIRIEYPLKDQTAQLENGGV